MSEIKAIWLVEEEDGEPPCLCFDSEAAVIDYLTAQIESVTWCLGTAMTFTIRAGEMEEAAFARLKEFEQ